MQNILKIIQRAVIIQHLYCWSLLQFADYSTCVMYLFSCMLRSNFWHFLTNFLMKRVSMLNYIWSVYSPMKKSILNNIKKGYICALIFKTQNIFFLWCRKRIFFLNEDFSLAFNKIYIYSNCWKIINMSTKLTQILIYILLGVYTAYLSLTRKKLKCDINFLAYPVKH